MSFRLAVAFLVVLAVPALAAPPRGQREKPVEIKPLPEEPAPQRPRGLSPQEIVSRANAYLNGISDFSATFVQVTGNGRRATGRLFLQRPGKIRFDYDAPVPTEIVGDGANVVVRDRKLNTSSVYPVSQTPLTFLLQADIDLMRDLRVTSAPPSTEGAYVTFDSPSTLVGNSKIAVFFDDEVRTLKKWLVIDAQGEKTLVTIGPVDRSPIRDPKTFDSRFQRPL